MTALICKALKHLATLMKQAASSWSSMLAINPLTTDDAFWHCQILAACYQLPQSILKIGEVGGCTALADSAWWRLQLPVEKPWSMTGWPLVCFPAQMGVENAPFTL